MPFVIIIFGLVLFVVAYQNNLANAGALLKSDVVGGSFLYWLIVAFFVGIIGYAKPFRPVSDAFLILLVVALFLANKGGFFTQFNAALKQIQAQNGVSLSQYQTTSGAASAFGPNTTLTAPSTTLGFQPVTGYQNNVLGGGGASSNLGFSPIPGYQSNL